MSHDASHPGLTRPLTALTAALVIAVTATVATAAGTLAGKAPPSVSFETASPSCDYLGDHVRAVVGLRLEGKGRWAYAEAKAVATDAAGKRHVGHLFAANRYDMKSASHARTPGPPVPASTGPVETVFEVRPVDRRGMPLQDVWMESDPYTCPRADS
jgi:hypothetical protein